jgi:hypothetical protein
LRAAGLPAEGERSYSKRHRAIKRIFNAERAEDARNREGIFRRPSASPAVSAVNF